MEINENTMLLLGILLMVGKILVQIGENAHKKQQLQKQELQKSLNE